MSSQRPHLNKSIVQLEGLFAESVNNLEVLQTLEAELRFRKVPRSVVLLRKVEERLSELASGLSVPRQSSLFSPPGSVATPGAEPTNTPLSQDAGFPAGRIGKAGLPKSQQKQPDATKVELPAYLIPAVEIVTAQPKKDNDPSSILSSWVATEALSPQTYKRPENLANDDKRLVVQLPQSLPWLVGAKSRPGFQLFYEIVLGAINMDEAGRQLVAAFGASEERERPSNQYAAIATFLIDARGIPLEEEGVGVSSFAWALPKALRMELSSLSNWPDVEIKAIEGLRQIINRTDDDNNPVPVDRSTIEAAHQWLVRSFRLPENLVEAPGFAIRRYHHIRANGLPEPQLLNSFFLNDLSRAIDLVSDGKAPSALQSYLGMIRPRTTINPLEDLSALETAVSPHKISTSRWPMGPSRSLVLLQQAAINLSRDELRTSGLFAVNGPPGTGKTTLLRDVVADVVVQRARVMAAFAEPDKAFKASGERIRAGSGFWQLYKIDAALRGFEILVASSNNKAVENISKELPGIGALGRGEPRYFKSVSDRVFNPVMDFGEPEAGVQDRTQTPLETWGLIAAVMGNRRNISSFQTSFWWDKDYSMRLYLKAAKGDDVREEVKDPATGKLTGYKTPKIIDSERPPAGEEAAKSAWRTAVARFRKLEKQTSDLLKERDQVRSDYLASFGEWESCGLFRKWLPRLRTRRAR